MNEMLESGDSCESALIAVVVESWRLTRTFYRVLGKLDASEGARYEGQLKFFVRRLQEALATAQLRIVDLAGQPYDPGMAASALNIADFGPEDHLWVEQMIEPLIMSDAGVKRMATIVLKSEAT